MDEKGSLTHISPLRNHWLAMDVNDSSGHLDIDDAGNGVVTEPRLYQLIRQTAPIADRQFELEFLDPGAAALCFTFG